MARAGVASQGLTEGGSASKLIHVLVGRTQVFTGCQQEFPHSLLAGSHTWFLAKQTSPTWHLVLAKPARERQLARWKSQSCNLVTEVIPHHFGCILFLRSKSLDQLKEDYTRV